jgi:hypothetical protein
MPNFITRGNSIRLFLALITALLTLPSWSLYYAPAIDDAYRWAYNYFADGNYQLAKDILFPQGPLVFLTYPLPIGNNLPVAILVHALLTSFLAYRLLSVSRINLAISAALVFIIMLVSDLQLVIFMLILTFLHGYLNKLKPLDLVIAVILTVFNLFIKSYGGIVSGLLVISALAYLYITTRNFKIILIGGATGILAYLSGWLMLFRTTEGCLNFLRGQVELSNGNSDAMIFAGDNNWLFLSVFIIAVAAIPIVAKGTGLRFFSIIMLLPLFAGWKHAMCRSEVYHMTGLFHFLILYLIVLILLFQAEIRPLALSCIALLAYFCNLVSVSNFKNHFPDYANRVRKSTTIMFNYHEIIADSKSESGFNIRSETLPDTIRKMISINQVDIYPWNYAIIPANNLNWTPRPVINSYSAYTRWLDQCDSAHFASDKAPAFIIWERTDPNSRGFLLESIDHRYLLNDEPSTMLAMLSNYKLKYQDIRYALFERRERPLPLSRKMLVHKTEIRFDEWYEMPAKQEGAMRALLECRKSIVGRIKSFFYKSSTVYIYYELEGGHILSHRIVPANAVAGIWLDPFIFAKGISNRVRRIKISCAEPGSFHPEIGLTFESIDFVEAANEVAIRGLQKENQEKTFGLTFHDCTFKASRENALKHGWSKEVNCTLQPGQSTGISGIALNPKDDNSKCRLIFTVLTRASKTCKAAISCFASDSTGTRLIDNWIISDNVEEDGQWTTISHFVDVDPTMQRVKKLSFFVFCYDPKQSVEIGRVSLIAAEQ